jgi:hypothetical protein
MNGKAWGCAVLLACAGSVHAGDDANDQGTYLSAQLGGGRIAGGDFAGKPGANPWMRSRAGELRIGRSLAGSTDSRLDVVYYNEGHPDNNHRDGYALQWTHAWRAGARMGGEFGIGPYFSMNTTVIDGRQLDDARWGVLLSAALRVRLSDAPDGTFLRVGVNHAQMPGVHRSDALMVGLARQFGPVAQDRGDDAHPFWFGVSAGTAVTSMPGTNTGRTAIVDAGRDIDEGAAHWAWSARYLFEGDDGRRVDRRGAAAQLWYVQEVTPGFSMRAGIGPYLSRNKREAPPLPGPTRRNVLISLQAERALSARTHIYFDFGRVKTFLRRDDRDLFLAGLRKRF